MGRKPGIEPGPGVPQTPVLAGTPLSPYFLLILVLLYMLLFLKFIYCFCFSYFVVSTIRISNELKEELNERKASPKDSYEDIIWDLLEDTLELNEETKREIAVAREEFDKGDIITHAKLKNELGL